MQRTSNVHAYVTRDPDLGPRLHVISEDRDRPRYASDAVEELLKGLKRRGVGISHLVFTSREERAERWIDRPQSVCYVPTGFLYMVATGPMAELRAAESGFNSGRDGRRVEPGELDRLYELQMRLMKASWQVDFRLLTPDKRFIVKNLCSTVSGLDCSFRSIRADTKYLGGQPWFDWDASVRCPDPATAASLENSLQILKAREGYEYMDCGTPFPVTPPPSGGSGGDTAGDTLSLRPCTGSAG